MRLATRGFHDQKTCGAMFFNYMMAFQSIYGCQAEVQDMMLHELEINEVDSMRIDHLQSLYRRLSIDYGDSYSDGVR